MEAQRMRAGAVGDRERPEGVSIATCHWSGRDNHALVGRTLCVSCILEPEWSWRMSQPYMDLGPVLDK